VFLDRDGVLIKTTIVDGKPYAVRPSQEAEMYDDVAVSCRILSMAGFLLVMVTNQPDILRGFTTREFVDQTNDRLKRELALDDVRVCYHDTPDKCSCRKPNPGLLLAAAADLRIDLGRSVIVGDRQTDIVAGQRAGCRTVFIDRGYHGEVSGGADFETVSLAAATNWILSRG